MLSDVRKLALLAVAAAALTFSAAGCTSDETGTATTASSSAVVSTADPSDTSEAPSTTSEDSGEITEIDAEVGDCVNLTGTMLDAKIAPATCGAVDSHYTVVAKVADENSCPSDVDQTYYEELNGSTTGVLCLDIDWVVGKCFEMGTASDSTVQVPCTGSTGERILAVLPNTVDETDCPAETETYYTYDERKKIVCTVALS
ncbi:LppU family putative lipoprotein [Williamsia sp. R60]